jgi:cytidine deaminase
VSADLLAAAEEAARCAYAPYSEFLVGAVARARDGRMFTGVNVENAAYPLGICAERCCLGAAATAGLKPGDLEEIAVTASPCGGCRQWLAEWRFDRVTYRRGNGEVATVAPGELLPDSFLL